MIDSIFFKRNEDALSYAFLAVLQKISPETRKYFFQDCGFGTFVDFGDLVDIESQKIMSDKSRPDGILHFSDCVVIFENKVKGIHSGAKLIGYYNQAIQDFVDESENVRILAGVDRDIELPLEVQSKIEKEHLSLDYVDVFSWQDVYKTCQKIAEEELYSSEIDKFLLNELKSLLSLMDLDTMPFEGLQAVDMKGFAKAWNQLENLEDYLKKRVPLELEMLDNYRAGDSHSSLFLHLLGFHFKKAYGKKRGTKLTYLYLMLDFDEEGIEIGIWSARIKDLEKLKKSLDLKKFAKEISQMEDYEIYYGSKPVNKIGTLDEKKIFRELSEGRGVFSSDFGISRTIKFEQLEADFDLNSEEFPRTLMTEILRLRNVAILFDDAL